MKVEKDMPLEETAEKKPPRRKKLLWIVGGVVGGLAVACAVICAVAAGGNRILNHTSVLGVDMSGLTREQAIARWQEQGGNACKVTVIPLTVDGEEAAEVSLAELGVTVTPEEAADAAWNAGHGGNFLKNGYALVRSWMAKTEAVPAMAGVTAQQLQKSVQTLKEKLDIAAIDGSYRVEADKKDGFYLTKCADGRTVDGDKLCAALLEALQKGDLSAIDCRSETIEAKPLDVQKLQKELSGEAKNAYYHASTGEITEGNPSVEFDAAKAQQLMDEAEAGKEFEVPAKVTVPKVTKKDLEGHLFTDLLGTYTTYASGSWGRLMNVSKAASMINGAVLNTGERFSYNEALGYQSAETGWYPAPGYINGKTVDMYGGGVCQVSSTLYYATLLANLKIVTRYCHQFAPGYITWGCDATVSEGAVDFVFENDRDYPIKIVAYDYNNYVTVEIYGTKVDDHYVQMVSKTLDVTDYKVVEKKTDKLAAGVRKVEQTPYTGYYVKTWRYVYDGNGNLISSDLEAVSDYEARDEIILVGTKQASQPKPDPVPDPKPDPTPDPTPDPVPDEPVLDPETEPAA